MKFEDMQADFESHPITGYLHTGEHLNVPLISHIVDNLYVGGCVDGADVEDFFSHIFSLYKWESYQASLDTKVYTVTMYDSHVGPDPVEIDDLSNRVVSALAKGGNVLVHCQAGINRSNLVAASALVKMGYTVQDAIALLREKRTPLVLANKTFESFLLNR